MTNALPVHRLVYDEGGLVLDYPGIAVRAS